MKKKLLGLLVSLAATSMASPPSTQFEAAQPLVNPGE